MALGYRVIPSSTKRENLASNLKAVELKLDTEDMAAKDWHRNGIIKLWQFFKH